MPMKKRKNKPKLDKNKYLQYLNSKKWKQIRHNTLDWYGNQCCKCGSKHNLEVHHVSYVNLYKETMKDLLVLCSRCHWMEHRVKIARREAKKESKIDRDTVTYYPNRKK